jgi:hypothetical protein
MWVIILSFITIDKKRTKYTSPFKTKLVLELLQNESTLVQIASKHNYITPKPLTTCASGEAQNAREFI